MAKGLIFGIYDKPFDSAGFSVFVPVSLPGMVRREKTQERMNNVFAFQFVLSPF